MHKNKISPRVAMITGAARRIGAVIARSLHQAGMNVLLHYRHSAEEAKNLCDELNALRPHSAHLVQANLSVAGCETGLMQQALAVWGRLDVLVNNASCFFRSKIGNTTVADWDELLTSNLKAPFFLSQAAAPFLALHQGAIINISDIHADKPMRDYGVYCIAKSGLNMLTRVLAKELGPKVRVNAVAPGAILWPEGANTLSRAQQQKILVDSCLKRAGEPKDIAAAVLFLASEATYVTGQILSVDGGRLL